MVVLAGGSVGGCTRADAGAGSAIRDQSGPGRETRTTVERLADPEQPCTYRRMVVGHTLAKGHGGTYLSRLVPTMPVGDR